MYYQIEYLFSIPLLYKLSCMTITDLVTQKPINYSSYTPRWRYINIQRWRHTLCDQSKYLTFYFVDCLCEEGYTLEREWLNITCYFHHLILCMFINISFLKEKNILHSKQYFIIVTATEKTRAQFSHSLKILVSI